MFFTLMLFKVSSFHVYAHQEDSTDQIESCTICDVAIENQDGEFLVTDFQEFDVLQNVVFEDKDILEIQHSRTSLQLYFRLFGRPPPTIV